MDPPPLAKPPAGGGCPAIGVRSSVVGSPRTRQTQRRNGIQVAPERLELERFGGALCCSWGVGARAGAWLAAPLHSSSNSSGTLLQSFTPGMGAEGGRTSSPCHGRPVASVKAEELFPSFLVVQSFCMQLGGFSPEQPCLLPLPPPPPRPSFCCKGRERDRKLQQPAKEHPVLNWLGWASFSPLRKPREAMNYWKNAATFLPSHKPGAVSAGKKFPLWDF